MQTINVTKDENGYERVIINIDGKNFEMSFQNNLDLYWDYKYEDSMLSAPLKQELIITKENSFLYNAFDNLYNAIMNNAPFMNYPNEEFKNDKELPWYDSAEQKQLVSDDKIIWRSDDFYFEEASILTIEKVDETFKVTFEKSKDVTDDFFRPYTYAIRIRNSGSRYDPFNISFMNMYNKLKEYDNQIYLEDIIYENEQRLVREKRG